MSSSFQPHNAQGYDPYHEACWQKLVTLYGYERASLIVTGKDPATNADLASWNRLGGVTVASVRGVR
jgi:hypothetical protein